VLRRAFRELFFVRVRIGDALLSVIIADHNIIQILKLCLASRFAPPDLVWLRCLLEALFGWIKWFGLGLRSHHYEGRADRRLALEGVPLLDLSSRRNSLVFLLHDVALDPADLVGLVVEVREAVSRLVLRGDVV